MAKEICQDCGRVFDGGAKAFFCPECRRERIRKILQRSTRGAPVTVEYTLGTKKEAGGR